MNELHRWIYEHAPEWSSEQWAYVVLALSIIGVLFRFFGQRLKPKLGEHGHVVDKVAIGIDFAEAEARNLRNRAAKREHDEKEN